MPAPTPLRLQRTWRYLNAWRAGGPPVAERELEVDRGDRSVPATLFLPRRDPQPSVRWVVLHGITRPGRLHPSLLRFARSLAATGASVLVPEVPEWIGLDLAPGRTAPTVRAALRALDEHTGPSDDTAPFERTAPPALDTPGGTHTRTGLMGFSFGAPQALITAGRPHLADRFHSVAGFGGYFDLERTFRYLLSGHHEWAGRTEARRPDPYGRWIVAANFLTGVAGYESAGSVAQALRALAREAGDRQLPSIDPAFDPVKTRLEAGLEAGDRALFRRFAPPAADDPAFDDTEAREWAARLAAAGRAAEPLADPGAHLGAPRAEVHLLHGRGDDLIPYTETLRLGEALRERGQPPDQLAITGLFAHSAADHRWHPLRAVGEAARFAGALSRVLAL
ncbi:hypothetical protein [Gaopeijia maritima]|uniref:hypothetical protein n=1 Tax=Gaopeijia maritima TaxID=3119007 RepID=UPI003295805E